jgi:hypothetical protein
VQSLVAQGPPTGAAEDEAPSLPPELHPARAAAAKATAARTAEIFMGAA